MCFGPCFRSLKLKFQAMDRANVWHCHLLIFSKMRELEFASKVDNSFIVQIYKQKVMQTHNFFERHPKRLQSKMLQGVGAIYFGRHLVNTHS